MTIAQIIIRIVNGTDAMPGFGSSLNASQLEALTEYLLMKDKEEGLKKVSNKKIN